MEPIEITLHRMITLKLSYASLERAYAEIFDCISKAKRAGVALPKEVERAYKAMTDSQIAVQNALADQIAKYEQAIMNLKNRSENNDI